MVEFNPFPKVSGKYGAPLGRASTRHDFTNAADLCVSAGQGEYDYGGTYWGLGGKEGPVYAVWERGKGKEGVLYIRAQSREEAFQKAMIG
jgi:hypothetical protein